MFMLCNPLLLCFRSCRPGRCPAIVLSMLHQRYPWFDASEVVLQCYYVCLCSPKKLVRSVLGMKIVAFAIDYFEGI